MKLPRVRIGTLLLLVVIAGLVVTLVVRERDAAKREAALQVEIARLANVLCSVQHRHIDLDLERAREYRAMYRDNPSR